MPWTNEPPTHAREGDVLTVTTAEKTDFWVETFYGFTHDDGHLWGEPVDGDFTAEVTVSAEYRVLYDQAGLMLRAGPDRWIKTGVEYAHGRATLGAVVTMGRSDWSIGGAVDPDAAVRLRLTRVGGAVCVQHEEAGRWLTLRLAPFDAGPALVGPMVCSPSRAGLVARFEGFRIGPAVDVTGEV
jgi:uncharacterized protein